MGRTSDKDYSDKFEDVITIVESRVNSRGIRVKVDDSEEMVMLLDMLNDEEQRKGKKPRMSSDFLEGMAHSRSARTPRVVGFGGRLVTLRDFLHKDHSSRGQAAHFKDLQDSENVFRYGDGRKARREIKGKRIFFRDLKTGRFVSKKERFE